MDRQKDAAWCIARQGKGSRCVSVGLGCVARWVWRGQGQGLWGVVPMSVGPSECRGSPAGWGRGLLTVGAGGQACAVFAPWPGGGLLCAGGAQQWASVAGAAGSCAEHSRQMSVAQRSRTTSQR